MWILRAVMLLALVVWMGGIIFFAFMVAPALFTMLPSPRMAGDVVSVVLGRLHAIGLIAGLAFLISSLAYNRTRYAQLRLLSTTHVLMVLMLVMTAISQCVVTPRMRDLRSGLPNIDSAAVRAEFDGLHAWSTRLEGAVLLCGLGVVILTARRFGNPGA